MQISYLFIDGGGESLVRRSFLPIWELVRIPRPFLLPHPLGWRLGGHHLQSLGDGGSIVVEYHVVMCAPVIHISKKYKPMKEVSIYLLWLLIQSEIELAMQIYLFLILDHEFYMMIVKGLGSLPWPASAVTVPGLLVRYSVVVTSTVFVIPWNK